MSPNSLYYEILDRTERHFLSYVSRAGCKAQNILNLDSNVERMPTETEAIYSEFEDLIEDNSELFLLKNVSAIQIQVDQFTGKLKNAFFQRSGEAHYTEWDLLQSDTQSRVNAIMPPMVSSETPQVNSLPPEEPPFLWLDRKKPDLVEKWNDEHSEDRQIENTMSIAEFVKVVYAEWHGVNLLKTDLKADKSLYSAIANIPVSKLSSFGLILPTKRDIYNSMYNNLPLPETFLLRIDQTKFLAAAKMRQFRS